MPLSDKAKLIQRLTKAAKDETRTPAARIVSARQLLRDTDFSQRSVRVAKHLGKLFMNDETQTPDIRKKASNLFQFCMDQRETAEQKNDADTITPAAPVNLGLDADIDEVLAARNKDVRSDPVAAKFIYFPRNDRNFLIQNFADLYDLLSVKTVQDLPESLFDGDPYNQLTEAAGRFHRTINPKWLSQYVAWKRAKFGDTIPPRESTYFTRFANEEEVQRWHALGTLVRFSDEPAGAELRKRELQTGTVKRWETSFLWNFWWQILLKNSTECYFMPADTPIQYLTEFPGVESKPVPQYSHVAKPQFDGERSLEVAAISPTIQPAAQVERVQLARPIGAPREICTFCNGLPEEVVPPHSCADYMTPASTVERAAVRTRRTVTPDTSHDERIKEKIVKAGFKDAIEGNRVRFDNQLITFSEWQKQHQDLM
jgi:hypothetical protein